MVPPLPCPSFPTCSPLLITSQVSCSQLPEISSLGVWWLNNTHRIPSPQNWFSFIFHSLTSTLDHAPWWVLTALFLILTPVPWPLYSLFPFLAFLSLIFRYFPKLQFVCAKTDLTPTMPVNKCIFSCNIVSCHVNFKVWDPLNKLKCCCVLKDFYFSTKEKSFPPFIPGNRAISGT